jgi:hypothetical protein
LSFPDRLIRFVGSRARAWQVRLVARLVAIPSWLAARGREHRYSVLTEADLRDARRSETAFVFGSGYSLNEITPGEWAEIGRHATIGFNYFCRQRFVRTDYHLVGEVSWRSDHRAADWKPAIREYAALITDNPFYESTILGVQTGLRAISSNRLVAMDLLKPGSRIFHYRRIARGVYRPPSRSLSEGLVQGAGSLLPCVNFAYILGFKQIVLAGVDLYDARYFWLPADAVRADMAESHGTRPGQAHHAAERTVDYLGRWAALLEKEGVRLLVQNPRSLLARVLPVYTIGAA